MISKLPHLLVSWQLSLWTGFTPPRISTAPKAWGPGTWSFQLTFPCYDLDFPSLWTLSHPVSWVFSPFSPILASAQSLSCPEGSLPGCTTAKPHQGASTLTEHGMRVWDREVCYSLTAEGNVPLIHHPHWKRKLPVLLQLELTPPIKRAHTLSSLFTHTLILITEL